MSSPQVGTGDRIIDPIIQLAGCSKQHRIVIAGSKSFEMMLEFQRRGYSRAAATGNCGRPAGQYDVALADWRRRPLRTLDPALDWLTKCLADGGVLAVWIEAQKPAVAEGVRASLEKRQFTIERSTVHDCGSAYSGRRLQTYPLQLAA